MDLLNDGDFNSYLTDLLKNKGCSDADIETIMNDVRLNYGGFNVYICKNEKVDGEVIRREVKKTGSVTKVARKYKKSRGFVYNYLR